MKKIISTLVIIFSLTAISAQELYWVFFTDKNGTQFDPYSYFDAKAIERRTQLGLSLYDSTDFPLNPQYTQAVSALSEEVVGESRWLNALAVSTSNIEQIAGLPFVKNIYPIENHTDITKFKKKENFSADTLNYMADQLLYMEGDLFVEKGLNGKGIRIAVLDGGFKMADTHPAFAHLRANHQIIKTYNFPLKKEDVYGWDSHGTMVLSCIAGYGRNGLQLGLATGAEFLLARTETNLEQKKEEVWWMMGMEWADANGANIINSSLGYGIDRYKPSEMDGTSLVARAANIAAAKGILVCNSMGNEGDDRSWYTLITPADADSVLSVGGIESSGIPSSFTSFGPTADGRRKPNVCAFGTAMVANPSKSNLYTMASGTSFSSPLTAGFAACAWQSHRELTNMQLIQELEKSGDKYPYYDYQFGYGVPQASYFVSQKKNAQSEILLTTQADGSLLIEIPEESVGADRLYYHIENEDGTLNSYQTMTITKTKRVIPVSSDRLKPGSTLRVWYNRQVAEYQRPSSANAKDDGQITSVRFRRSWQMIAFHNRNTERPSAWGVNSKVKLAPYIAWGFVARADKNNEKTIDWGKSETFLAGLRLKGNICKWYSLGFAIELGATWYVQTSYIAANYPHNGMGISRFNTRSSFLQGEFFQRFRVAPGGLFGYGIFFDTGIYAGYVFSNRKNTTYKLEDGSKLRTSQGRPEMAHYQWGVRARFGYDIIAVYAQYRINSLFEGASGSKDFPKLEFGLQLTLPIGR